MNEVIELDLWERVKHIITNPKKSKRGRPLSDDRVLFSGMIWILQNDGRWRDMPKVYGPYQTVYGRYQHWVKKGKFEKIMTKLLKKLKTERKIDTSYV